MEQASTTPAPLNPWRTIWFSPRRTIRLILDAEVRPNWIPVIVLAALHQTVASIARDPVTGAVSVANSTMPVIIGALQLVFAVIVGPFLYALIGGMFGGEADADDIRQGVVWSYVPFASAGVLVMPLALLYGGAANVGDLEDVQVVPLIATIAALLVTLMAILWVIVLTVITLAEVQRFSILRAIACIVLPTVPFLVLAALI